MDISPTRTLDRAALIRLYDAVGWSSYTRRPEDFGPMIENAWLVLSAWAAGQLVGLARVVGDGATAAYIQDLLVDPAHQRRGIGRALLTEVLAETSHIRQIYISTDDADWNRHVVKLYRSLGFRPTPDLGGTTLAIMR
ncbi:N-acetyltransferase [Kocuria tytonicola]|uniref:N-acetyltransferase n=1 Tax=Kocuria tytonicola TaxID=2055946 RepID=A0A3L9LWM8_9MICC|nr:GNAT family N-acetyltransferase [Kocuria tytonicola]RLY94105.1 N-acetyltransferase [Kocuria tytonicola]RLZ03474.1 N-acetyltransferase [Kocuria tytonicola]